MATTRKEKLNCLFHPRTKQPVLYNLDVKKCETNFLSNNQLLREELISSYNGDNLAIHFFPAKEVTRMSKFTDKDLCHMDSTFNICNGMTNGQRVYIKKFYNLFFGMSAIIREIVAAAQMNVHKHALKLLGCCLETDFPILIYEFPIKGCLVGRLYKKNRGNLSELNWKMRLKIGYEIAFTLAYLHNGFHRRIIHRNLSLKDIFLDENYEAKVSFYLSVSLPKGDDHLMDIVVGTNGFTEPEYANLGKLTKKTDVYLFGILFLKLLARQKWFNLDEGQNLTRKGRDHCENGRTHKVLDEEIFKEVKRNGKQQEVVEVLGILSRCLANKGDDRPDIVDVVVTLKKYLEFS